MGRKSPYPVEFRNDAVALYRAAGGKRTYAAVAADVGGTGETLRSWVRQADEHAGLDHGRGEQSTESRDETMRKARLEIFQWLTYYNARRRHSALNYLSSAEFEQQQRARKLTLAA
ncbi:integrase core domain-containing protein [Streptomyces sp. NBC_00365]|uniref:integrase core domain-containing protein n=1 Tax=Streptomyces sp. NBC_00365 TaxID=2975726 RepID=UPI0022562DBB|nr:transposase [Streptomyces sp. NBC_00365]MCX5093698.1 integrase core domain-containing protein [Streptomyces sp. NBC_00365]